MEQRARLPDAFIAELKQRVDLVSLIGERVPLKRSGRSYTGCCPFHEDRQPSFTVDPVRGTYLCRGCKADGDAFKWMQAVHGLAFWDALVALADRYGMQLPRRQPRTESEVREMRETAAAGAALRQAASLYTYGLEHHASARAYLSNERGLTSETLQAFGVGYVRSGIRALLNNRVRSAEDVIRAGIVTRQEDGRETEVVRNRVTIALRNERGHIVGFAGRIMLSDRSAPKYLNTPETVLFHKSRELFGLDLARTTIMQMRSAVVVEGYFDVMSLHQQGDRRAVAGMGTELSKEQADRLLRDAETVYLCLDGDAAGQRATVRAAKMLLSRMKDGAEVRVVRLPGDQDPDSFVREHGIAAWRAQLDGAMRLSDYVVDVICAEADAAVPESVVRHALAAREWLSLCEGCPLYGQALRVALQRRLAIEL